MAPPAGALLVRLKLPVAPTTTSSHATATTRRRPRESSESSSDSSASDAPARSSARRRVPRDNGTPKKRRKPTSTVRKEEKRALLTELAELEATAERLRTRVGLHSLAEDRALESLQREAREMEHTRRAQLLALCQGHALLSKYMRAQFAGPLKIPVVLGKDPVERRATLLALRQPTLDIAAEYLENRLAGIDDRAPFSDYQSWTSDNGDFCFHRSDITQFQGVGSVKNVFDAVLFYMSNMEIAISEQLGQLTLREDIDAVGTRISHHRIVSSTDHGVVVEVNSVAISEFFESPNGESDSHFGILTNTSVDVDELYPFCPESRVCRTVNAAMRVSSFRKPGDGGEGELVVVLRRCAYLSMKKPLFEVSEEAMEDLLASISAWGAVMIKVIGERARTLAVCAPEKSS